MKYCSKCGRPLPEDGKINHCQICGAKIENKISYDNTNSLLKQNVNMNIHINNSKKQEHQSIKKNTNEESFYDSRAHVVSEKTNGLNEKAIWQHLVAEEQGGQEGQPEMDLPVLLDSPTPKQEEAVAEEEKILEKQPELNLSRMLYSSTSEPKEPVVEEQKTKEEQDELDLPVLFDSSISKQEEAVAEEDKMQEKQPEFNLPSSFNKSNIKAEEIVENVKEPSNNFDKTITSMQDEVTANEKLEKYKQDEIKYEEVADDRQQDVLQKDLKLNNEPQIDFSDIDPMFGGAPTFDAEAIQRAYNESKKNKEISKNKKSKKIFGKQKGVNYGYIRNY